MSHIETAAQWADRQWILDQLEEELLAIAEPAVSHHKRARELIGFFPFRNRRSCHRLMGEILNASRILMPRIRVLRAEIHQLNDARHGASFPLASDVVAIAAGQPTITVPEFRVPTSLPNHATLGSMSATTTTTDLAGQVIAILRTHEAELRRAGIRHLSLFGSVARGDAEIGSDVDLAAEFDPAARMDLVHLVALERHLAEMLGRRVEILPEPAERPRLRANIERDRVRAF